MNKMNVCFTRCCASLVFFTVFLFVFKSLFFIMAWKQQFSKFRNIKGVAFPRDYIYPDLQVSSTAENNIVAASPLWIAVLWSTATGGSVGILGHNQYGKRQKAVPLIHAHQQPINDLAWNPFFDWMLATASTDATVKLWKLPEFGLEQDLSTPEAELKGHQKRVDAIAWNNTAW